MDSFVDHGPRPCMSAAGALHDASDADPIAKEWIDARFSPGKAGLAKRLKTKELDHTRALLS